MTNVEFDLRRQTEAARDLVLMLRNDGPEDAGLVADTIEGETTLLEAITAALDEIDEAEVLILGGKAKIAQIEARVDAEAHRVERLRAAIERAIITSEAPTPIKLPTATISISKRKPSAVIDNEAEIPARFFVQPPAPPPKLDKKALADALATEEVPGAHLDNGSISLLVRRK